MKRFGPSSKTMFVAGNNCYASKDTCGEFGFSSLDRGMLFPFIQSWPGDAAVCLTVDSRTHRTRTDGLPEAICRQMLSRRFSRGPARLAAMPLVLVKMLKYLRRGTAAYARLPSPLGACLVLAALLRRRPLICSLHGSPRWMRKERSWQSLFGLGHVYRWVTVRAIRRADLIFATDPGVGANYGLDTRRLEIFSNTLLTEVPDLPQRSPATAGTLELGFVGRLSHEKNPGFAIQVLRSLLSIGVQVHLTIVGDGPMRGSLEDEAQDVEEFITFAGWIDDREQVQSHLRGFHFLLLPSLSEGSPKVMVEAMANGVIVVTWKINSTIIELGDRGRSAVVLDSLSANEWAAAIRETMEPTNYEAVARRAHDRVGSRTVDGLITTISAHMRNLVAIPPSNHRAA